MRDDNIYALKADNVVTKYIAVENSNLKELFAKLGVEDTAEIPNSIPTNYEEILKINRRYSNIQLAKTKGNAVKCNQTNEVFYSYASAKRKYGVDLSYYFNTKCFT